MKEKQTSTKKQYDTPKAGTIPVDVESLLTTPSKTSSNDWTESGSDTTPEGGGFDDVSQ